MIEGGLETPDGSSGERMRVASRERRRLAGALLALVGFLCLALAGPTAAAAEARCAPLAGEWNGISSCLDRSVVPNCADEHVRFRFSSDRGSGHVALDAMKRSGDRYISMGAADFTCGQNGEWRSEIGTPQYRGTWTLELRANILVAELRIEPSNALARRATLRR